MTSDSSANKKDGRLKKIVRELATEFVERESNRQSLVTVTDIRLADKGKRALILLSVFPETAERAVIDFLKRRRGSFREFVVAESALGRIPFFDFSIDLGEKNRQKIDRMSRS
jgi:ribosome-binding factor A